MKKKTQIITDIIENLDEIECQFILISGKDSEGKTAIYCNIDGGNNLVSLMGKAMNRTEGLKEFIIKSLQFSEYDIIRNGKN